MKIIHLSLAGLNRHAYKIYVGVGTDWRSEADQTVTSSPGLRGVYGSAGRRGGCVVCHSSSHN